MKNVFFLCSTLYVHDCSVRNLVCRMKERTQTRCVENGMLWRFTLTAGTGVLTVFSLVASHVQGNDKQHTYTVTLQQSVKELLEQQPP
jgi:hypothetical protein